MPQQALQWESIFLPTAKEAKSQKNFPILASLHLCDFALKETCLVAARPR